MNWLLKGIGFEDETDDEAEAIKIENKAKKQKLKEAKRKEREAQRLGRTNAKLSRYESNEDEQADQPQQATKSNLDEFNISARYANADANGENLGGYTDQNFNNDLSGGVGGYGSKNVVFFYPKNYTEAHKLIDYLKQGESVMLNLDEVGDSEAQRMLDFASGAIYAVNGSIQRVSGNIFLLTPEGLNIIAKQ